MIRFIKSQRKFILATGLGLAVLSSPVMAKEAKASKAKVVHTTVKVSKTSVSGQVKKVSYSPVSAKAKFASSGVASYYGPGFHGRRTANGETFNMHAMTAAHRTLPFGTLIKVTNLSNGKSTIVRVNDRGPYVGNRVIDLSVAAAKEIGSTHSGTARVNLEVIN
ncbi:MAG: septal ring lytic transglycosylase RlpA family protein [Hydromonas sp.]|jgi:rare lipoprotein A|nr:septal ring lytic transglycosylase RlpA family protein [Hydromonas sp.]MBP6294245.1 septal ring lytic transglycosylase RlpA family protein [Hydromonas sp.]